MVTKENYEQLLLTKELTAYEFRDITGILLKAYNDGHINHFVFDIETKGLDLLNPTCNLIGFSFADPIHKVGYFVGHTHPDFLISENEKSIIISCLFKLLYNIPCVGHNLKFDLSYLVARYNLDMKKVVVLDDTLFMSYYYYGAKRDTGIALSLKSIFRHLFGVDLVWEEELSNALMSHKRISDRHFNNVPYEIISKYGAYDSIATYYLRLGLKEKLKTRITTAYDFLIKSIHVFVELETQGISLDWEFRDYLRKCYAQKIEAFENQFQNSPIIQTWKEDHFQEFNLNSIKMIGEILYGEHYYKCPVLLKTDKGSASTNEAALLELIKENKGRVPSEAKEFIKELLGNRNSVKMVTTYLEPLDERRVNDFYCPDYNLIGTSSGRLSSFFHTIPSGNDIKRLITSRFQSIGGIVVASDFSQLEVCTIGAISDDPTLREAYIKGYDVHSYIASSMFNKPADRITKTERKSAKIVVFGILYGKAAHSLSEELEITREEAQKLIDFFFVGFPKIKEFIDAQHRYLKKHKYVTTPFGRVRYLPDIDSPEWKKQSEALRAAQNTPIQSTASDIAFSAAIRIYYDLRNNYKSKFVGTVHDSIIVDAHPDEIQDVLKLMKYHMNTYTNTEYKFLNGLPISSDFEVGTSWGGSCAISKFTDNVWILSGPILDANNLIDRIKIRYPNIKVSEFQEQPDNSDNIIKFVNPGKKVKFKIVWS